MPILSAFDLLVNTYWALFNGTSVSHFHSILVLSRTSDLARAVLFTMKQVVRFEFVTSRKVARLSALCATITEVMC